jgi:molybdenum cofactor cytidylyltransferase
MGAFKPLLPWGGATVIEASIGLLRDGGAEEVIVVVGYHAELLGPVLAPLNVKVALNEQINSEMAYSIALGVERLAETSRAVIVALADQPAIPPGVVSELIMAWKNTGSLIVRPEHCGQAGHPVLIDLRLRSRLVNLGQESGLRGLLAEHRNDVLRVQVSSPLIARDMDTWEDYSSLHQDAFGTLPYINGK